jgi:hypothetical protein
MTPINTDLIPAINDSLEINLPDNISFQELKENLAAHINNLINQDFEKLVSLLYRIDVNETKMRGLLDNTKGENAAGLITDLIIERQLQKIKSRKETKSKNDIPDDEKW